MSLALYIKAGKFVKAGRGSVCLYDPKKKVNVYISDWFKLGDALNANFIVCARETWKENVK